MKTFVILSCFIAVAVARPEAGYVYNAPPAPAPSHNYVPAAPVQAYHPAPAPSHNYVPAAPVQAYHPAPVPSHTYVPAAPAPAYHSAPAPAFHSAPAPAFHHAPAPAPAHVFQAPAQVYNSAPAPITSYSHQASGLVNSPTSHQLATSGYVQAPSTSFTSTGNNGFSSSGSSFNSVSSGSSFNGANSGSNTGFSGANTVTNVQRHIYVHVPPQEAEEHHAAQNAAPIQNQKHYKIIFIKAPSAPTYSQAQLAAATQSHTEEKTIVYVLSKKPQDLSEIVQAAAQAPVVPSKPEVFFIKYKAQEGQADSTSAIGATGSVNVGGGDSYSHEHHTDSHAHSHHHHSTSGGVPAPVYGPAH